MVDGVQWGVDLHLVKELAYDDLLHIAAAILAARGVEVTALASAGAIVEYLNIYTIRKMLEAPRDG